MQFVELHFTDFRSKSAVGHSKCETKVRMDKVRSRKNVLSVEKNLFLDWKTSKILKNRWEGGLEFRESN